MLGLDCQATSSGALNRKTDPTGRTPLSPETEGCLLLTELVFESFESSVPYLSRRLRSAGVRQPLMLEKLIVCLGDMATGLRTTLRMDALKILLLLL